MLLSILISKDRNVGNMIAPITMKFDIMFIVQVVFVKANNGVYL